MAVVLFFLMYNWDDVRKWGRLYCVWLTVPFLSCFPFVFVKRSSINLSSHTLLHTFFVFFSCTRYEYRGLVRHPVLKTTVLNMLESSRRKMTEQKMWRAEQPSQVASVLENLKCWGAWDTTCKHSQAHHFVERHEERVAEKEEEQKKKRKEKQRLTLYLQRTLLGNSPPNQHWSCFRDDTEETSASQNGAHAASLERLDATLSKLYSPWSFFFFPHVVVHITLSSKTETNETWQSVL